MSNDLPEGEESDLRRRAAWLLGMLVLVAALFVGLMVTFFNNSGSSDGNNGIADPTSSASSAGSPSRTPVGSTSSARRTPSSSPTGSGSSTAPKPASCPGTARCALDDDIGNAVKAINAYRAQKGLSAVPGSVSAEAKQCALNDGNGCSGGWAETMVPKPDGTVAVQKILQFGRLTSDMKSIEVGWAYDPGSKQYYFAIIRKV